MSSTCQYRVARRVLNAETTTQDRSRITFRDYLRDHPEARDTFEVIKRGAAEMFPNDIDRYIALKGPFVRGIVSMVSNPQR